MQIILLQGIQYRKISKLFHKPVATRSSHLCDRDSLGSLFSRLWDDNCQNTVLERCLCLFRVERSSKGEGTGEGSDASLRDPILGSSRGTNIPILIRLGDGGGFFLAGGFLSGSLLSFVGDFFDADAVRFRRLIVAGTLFEGLLRLAADGERLAVAAEFDVDLSLLVPGDFYFDLVFGLGLADVGAIGAIDVGVAEEGGVEVEEGMVIELVEKRSFATVHREEW
jgi:hypothetical protein